MEKRRSDYKGKKFHQNYKHQYYLDHKEKNGTSQKTTFTMITKLCEIASLYKTDKAGWYTPFYSLLFEPYRNQFRKILEVGIGTKEAMGHVPGYMPGASLFMWNDYFPFADVYGVDIDPKAIVDFSRIRSVTADSRSGILHGLLPLNFDLIVDDGCHEVQVQFETFLNLFPLVKENGFYIIEDAEGWYDLSNLLEGYAHQVVICSSINGASGKLILIRK